MVKLGLLNKEPMLLAADFDFLGLTVFEVLLFSLDSERVSFAGRLLAFLGVSRAIFCVSGIWLKGTVHSGPELPKVYGL